MYARIAYLTIGGYDERDVIGNFDWFEFPTDSWSMSNVYVYANDHALDTYVRHDNGSEHGASVMFQTGYPFIGLPVETYRDIRNLMQITVPTMNCSEGEHWGMCRVESTGCDLLSIPLNLTFEINTHTERTFNYSIPIENMLAYV